MAYINNEYVSFPLKFSSSTFRSSYPQILFSHSTINLSPNKVIKLQPASGFSNRYLRVKNASVL